MVTHTHDNILFLSGIEPRFLGRPVRSIFAISTELRRTTIARAHVSYSNVEDINDERGEEQTAAEQISYRMYALFFCRPLGRSDRVADEAGRTEQCPYWCGKGTRRPSPVVLLPVYTGVTRGPCLKQLGRCIFIR
jgi:hypothetical protein